MDSIQFKYLRVFNFYTGVSSNTDTRQGQCIPDRDEIQLAPCEIPEAEAEQKLLRPLLMLPKNDSAS